ncbi:TcpQ domain-containing protein [Lacisediminimonas sp.]|uniref:TcpQ domain-containing protein n=1 Tax=Lacisediminimonas sp. TaxID=3060582 RepID=UPI0027157357|nr:TcpQ domain-containing protein [Lacisediminimonas sp.]MDO8301190.1 TcpQ domain-containing protein [Lacisediminimonas sp.]
MPGYKSNPFRLALLLLLSLPGFVHAAQTQAHEPPVSVPMPLLAAAGDMSAATPTPVAPSVASRKAVRYVWRINVGDKISDAFRAWARQSRKWQVVWEAPELVSQAAVDVDGNFEDAVSKVIEALNRGDAQLIARFYVDSANSVLRVMEKK